MVLLAVKPPAVIVVVVAVAVVWDLSKNMPVMEFAKLRMRNVDDYKDECVGCVIKRKHQFSAIATLFGYSFADECDIEEKKDLL